MARTEEIGHVPADAQEHDLLGDMGTFEAHRPDRSPSLFILRYSGRSYRKSPPMKTCDRTGICYTAQMCRKAREKDDDPLPLSSPTGVRPLPQERAGGTWGRGRSTVCGP